MKDFHFDAISAFENYEIEKMRDGHVVVTTKVVNSSLNYYGNAHGGFYSHYVTKSVVWWLSRWDLMG
ncbi:thioesterase [Streptococcus pneumoniae]|nr:thioesterase [Streptococcus pneumoniae]